MSNTPSDAEIWELIPDDWTMTVQHAPGAKALVLCNVEDFARAVLARWGTPQPVVREPLTDEQRMGVFNEAMKRCDENLNLSWRVAILEQVEIAHGITQKGGKDGL